MVQSQGINIYGSGSRDYNIWFEGITIHGLGSRDENTWFRVKGFRVKNLDGLVAFAEQDGGDP